MIPKDANKMSMNSVAAFVMVVTTGSFSLPPTVSDPIVKEGKRHVDLPSTSGQYSTPMVMFDTTVRGSCGPLSLFVRFSNVEREAIRGPVISTATRLQVRKGNRVIVDDPKLLRPFDGYTLISARPVCANDVMGLSLRLRSHKNPDQYVTRDMQFTEGRVSYFRQAPVMGE